MSRQTIVKAISELNELLDEEAGICGGKKKVPAKTGGIKLAYGSGLIAAPNHYGFDPYVHGFVPPQQRGGMMEMGCGIGGYGIGGAQNPARVRAAKNNPWIEFAKLKAKQTGRTYGEIISDPYFQDEYHRMFPNNQRIMNKVRRVKSVRRR